MEKIKEKITKCIDSEIKIYNEMLSLTLMQKEILVKNEESKLEKIIKKQNELIKKIQKQEQIRINLEKELPKREKSLKFPCSKTDSLRELIHKIKEINITNMVLIRQGSNSVRTFLELITGSGNQNLYQQNGQRKLNPTGSILINKKV